MPDQLTESYRQYLPATRDLIADRDRWTTGVLALRSDGISCGPRSRYACAWCLTGAFIRATGIRDDGKAEDVLTELLDDVPACVNDREGHAAVLALLDCAIRVGSPVQSP